jgi:hypothetical protein
MKKTILDVLAEKHPGAFEELQAAMAEAYNTGDHDFHPDVWIANYLAKKAGAYDA